MNAGYHINVFWGADDEKCIAAIPDLSGCSASGTTPEEAVREVQVALELWLQVASEKGQPIPPPRSRPAIDA